MYFNNKLIVESRIMLTCLIVFVGSLVFGREITLDRDKLITEGRHQFKELLKFNAENEKRGCVEDNIYVFSLLNGQEWAKYVKTDPSAEEFLDETKDQLNERLKQFNTHPDFSSDYGIYLCLVTELPVQVHYDFTNNKTFEQVIAEYYLKEKEAPGFGGEESAVNVASLEEQWKEIIDEVFNGTEESLKTDQNFSAFNAKPNKLFITQSLVQVELMDDEGDNNSIKKVINAAKHKGYFKDHKEKIYEYEKEMLPVRHGKFPKLINRVLSYIEFAEGQLHDSTKAQQRFIVADQTTLAADAHAATNNEYDQNDLINPSLFLYDFTGIFGIKDNTQDQVSLDDLNQILDGSYANSNTKLKVFLTDEDVTQAKIDMVKNLNINQQAYVNSLVLWVHINSDGVIESTIRVHPGLQNQINKYLNYEKFKSLVEQGLTADLLIFTGKEILKHYAKIIYTSSEFLISVLESLEIPAKYYRTDTTNYTPILKEFLSYAMPAMLVGDFIANEFFSEYAADYPMLTSVSPSEAQFALMCGLWNGIIGELKGILDMVSMVGYFVDETKKDEVDQMIGMFRDNSLWSIGAKMGNGLINAHTGHATKVAHQIGVDVITVVSIVVPITKVGAASKLGKVINLVDNLNPMTHIFNTAGLAVRRVGGAAVDILKDGTTKIGYFTKGKFIALEQHMWTAAKGTIEALEKIPVPQTVILQTSGGYQTVALVLMTVKKNGNTSKMLGKAIDDAGKALIKLSLKSEFDFGKLFKNIKEADYIAENISLLDNANLLYNTTALKDAIKNLPTDDLKKAFFKNLANIGNEGAGVADPNWFGKHLLEFSNNPKLIEAWATIGTALKTSTLFAKDIATIKKVGQILEDQILLQKFGTLAKLKEELAIIINKNGVLRCDVCGNKGMKHYSKMDEFLDEVLYFTKNFDISSGGKAEGIFKWLKGTTKSGAGTPNSGQVAEVHQTIKFLKDKAYIGSDIIDFGKKFPPGDPTSKAYDLQLGSNQFTELKNRNFSGNSLTQTGNAFASGWESMYNQLIDGYFKNVNSLADLEWVSDFRRFDNVTQTAATTAMRQKWQTIFQWKYQDIFANLGATKCQQLFGAGSPAQLLAKFNAPVDGASSVYQFIKVQ